MSLGDLPPRQKMINLMYLVLLCLLAMNVSKEILHSFLIINEGLERTTDNFEHKIDLTYEKFKRMNADDPKKVGEFYEHAVELKKNADDIVEYIDEIKKKLYQEVDKIPAEIADTLKLKNLQNMDNQDVGAQVMIGPDQTNPLGPDVEYSALSLKEKIKLFNDHLAEFIHEEEMIEDMQIPLEDQKMHELTETWEVANFYHLPMAATITNLTRFQASVRNSEADALKELMREIGEDDFAFDTLAVKVIPTNGTYIAQGDSFKAEVIVAAYSTTKNPQLIIGEVDTTGEEPDVKEGDTSNVTLDRGIATYGVKTSTLGEQEWGGVIKILKPNGKWKAYSFKHKYMVATPSLVVSPTKMNVFYKGLENPISVSVSGMASEKLKVNVVGGGCRVKPGKKAGEYEVIPNPTTKDKTVKVMVSSTEEGAKPFEPYEFRLKSVPKPIPFFNGETGSVDMKLSKLRNGKFISARLEDFLFDLRYRVLQFEMFVSVGGKSSTLKAKGGKLTSQMVGILKKMKPGQTVIFQKVVAQMDKPGAPKVSLDGNIIVHVK
jgi:gliding motility-associated protein GldM